MVKGAGERLPNGVSVEEAARIVAGRLASWREEDLRRRIEEGFLEILLTP